VGHDPRLGAADPVRDELEADLIEGPSTEVELVFTPVAAGSTRIDLEHRGWELLGDGALKREGYDEGWEQLLGRFRAVADAG
jgi:hypothetical protein